MKGITVLYTYQGSLLLNFLSYISLIIGVIGVLTFICMLFYMSKSKGRKYFYKMCVLLWASATLISYAIRYYESPSWTYLKVTISNDVKFVEMNEHYIVVDRQGDLWTLREKDNDK